MSTSSAPPFDHVSVARTIGELLTGALLLRLHFLRFLAMPACLALHRFFLAATAVPDEATAVAPAVAIAMTSAPTMAQAIPGFFPLLRFPPLLRWVFAYHPDTERPPEWDWGSASSGSAGRPGPCPASPRRRARDRRPPAARSPGG